MSVTISSTEVESYALDGVFVVSTNNRIVLRTYLSHYNFEILRLVLLQDSTSIGAAKHHRTFNKYYIVS